MGSLRPRRQWRGQQVEEPSTWQQQHAQGLPWGWQGLELQGVARIASTQSDAPEGEAEPDAHQSQ